jgi:hypothetical protein
MKAKRSSFDSWLPLRCEHKKWSFFCLLNLWIDSKSIYLVHGALFFFWIKVMIWRKHLQSNRIKIIVTNLFLKNVSFWWVEIRWISVPSENYYLFLSSVSQSSNCNNGLAASSCSFKIIEDIHSAAAPSATPHLLTIFFSITLNSFLFYSFNQSCVASQLQNCFLAHNKTVFFNWNATESCRQNKFPNESLKIQAWINKENFHKINNELSSKQFF